jgi:ABC-type Fe3+-siderophore transport system permease subunit
MNPIGGLTVAIPLAVLKLRYPPWLVVATGVPLTYLQVVAVDLGWSSLERWAWFRGLVLRRRSARIEALAASGGAFWPTAILAPLVGAWLVMAVMRYARVPQRRVAAPILLGVTVVASALTALCVLVPGFFKTR